MDFVMNFSKRSALRCGYFGAPPPLPPPPPAAPFVGPDPLPAVAGVGFVVVPAPVAGPGAIPITVDGFCPGTAGSFAEPVEGTGLPAAPPASDPEPPPDPAAMAGTDNPMPSARAEAKTNTRFIYDIPNNQRAFSNPQRHNDDLTRRFQNGDVIYHPAPMRENTLG
jgi:hypothetical protein